MNTHTAKPRKACDLCYRKRIKCDGKVPRCSQCQIYDCQCTHQAARRRKKPPKSRAVQQSDVAAEDSITSKGMNKDSTEFTGRNYHYSYESSAPTFDGHEDVLPGGDDLQLPTFTDGSSLDVLLTENPVLPWDAELTIFDTLASLQLPLPPESIVRSLIDTYLVDFNSLLPLFDPYQLTRTVDQWYSSPTRRTRTSWAVINTVMAISQYCSTSQLDQSDANFPIGSTVSDCLSKAQSALTELLMGDIELVNLQIVLGLVIVFRATPDVKPAVFLISTAVRLCQVLGLHRRDSNVHRNANPRDLLQYERVFWITYILDRDLALRIRQAPIQQDADISIELPSTEPEEDAAGSVSISAAQQHNGFNVFRAHVQLAQIQGHIYDALFSVRAQQLNPGERAANSQAIRLLLKDWKNRIPPTLNAMSLTLTQSSLPSIIRLFCMLYGTVVTCLGLLCQVNAMDFNWIDQLRDYGRSISSGIGELRVPPPQPQGWNALVNESRDFMALFIGVEEKGPAFISTNICPFASSLICLAANSIVNFDNRDELESHDRHLKSEAVEFLRNLKRQTNHKTLVKVLDAFTELDSQYRLMTAT